MADEIEIARGLKIRLPLKKYEEAGKTTFLVEYASGGTSPIHLIKEGKSLKLDVRSLPQDIISRETIGNIARAVGIVKEFREGKVSLITIKPGPTVGIPKWLKPKKQKTTKKIIRKIH